MAVKARDEANQLKQAAETDEWRKSLQHECERAARLEQDLATSRRDLKTQTDLATKASDEANQLKQAGESGAGELRKSLQQEREKTQALSQELSNARAEMYSYQVLARNQPDL